MEKSKRYKIYKIIMIVVLTAFITFMVTSISLYSYFVKNPVSVSAQSTNKDIASKLTKYREIIDKYYLGDVEDTALEEGAIKGYIEGLGDPYTEYISKEEMDTYLDDTMGNFVGIGIYMIKNTQYDKIQVLSTIKGSPAEKAGIQAGDLIISADGVEYSADDMTTASNKIKGEEGTKVTIEVLRGAEKLKFELTREKVKVNQVEGKVLSNNIGYIKFTSFDETTAEDFKNQYQELAKKGIQSLIIDLRNNGGGIVEEAINIADLFTTKNSTLLITTGKNTEEEITKAKKDKEIDMPIVILVNENTASASEILTAAIKENCDKVTIVGKTTFGKGVIQTIFTLTDGSGLKLTTNEYYTPKRNKINKIGIKPDVEVDFPENESVYSIEKQKDTQLQKAIELLK